MKESGKILVGVGIAAVVIVAAVVVLVRLIFGAVVTVPIAGGVRSVVSSVVSATKSFDLKGFTGVSASGTWELTIKQGSAYSIEVTVPDNIVDRLDIRTHGKILSIGLKPGTTPTNWRMSAAVTMPSLDTVQLSGANRATFGGFSGGRLNVECSGAVSVVGSGGGYRNIKIDASGAASVDLRDLPTVDAEVHISGAGQADLQMQGGALTGQLSGAAKVIYWGSVSGQAIQTSGIGNVVHR